MGGRKYNRFATPIPINIRVGPDQIHLKSWKTLPVICSLITIPETGIWHTHLTDSIRVRVNSESLRQKIKVWPWRNWNSISEIMNAARTRWCLFIACIVCLCFDIVLGKILRKQEDDVSFYIHALSLFRRSIFNSRHCTLERHPVRVRCWLHCRHMQICRCSSTWYHSELMNMGLLQTAPSWFTFCRPRF